MRRRKNYQIPMHALSHFSTPPSLKHSVTDKADQNNCSEDRKRKLEKESKANVELPPQRLNAS